MSIGSTATRRTLLQALIAITIGLACLATMFAVPARALGEGYWSTDGSSLVDSNGDEVRITGVNWFGFETSVLVPHGLWQRNWQDMLDQIAAVGFNTIRLPYSSAILDPGAMPDSIDYVANPDLDGLSSVEVMDRIVDYAGDIGLKIILDRHTLEPDNRHDLWYNAAYPPERLISDWQTLAERYSATRPSSAPTSTTSPMPHVGAALTPPSTGALRPSRPATPSTTSTPTG